VKKLLICIGLALTSSLLVAASAGKQRDPSKLPPPAEQAGVTYAGHIKAIFDKACLDCHGSRQSKAQIRLDSIENVLKGGKPGKIVQPGDSAQSLLVYAVARTQADAMPPKGKGNPLSREQVALIRAWIDQGSK
jgi:mono/diheme cytochrome c family protein